jgi:DNA-binding transcriptional ArsR family regulator
MDALQVVSEPRRRAILRLVWDRELSAGEIAGGFDVTFGAVSQHLGVLRDAGFVRVRRDRNRRLYQADRVRLGPLAATLEAMWDDTLDRLAAAAESDPDALRDRSRRSSG